MQIKQKTEMLIQLQVQKKMEDCRKKQKEPLKK